MNTPTLTDDQFLTEVAKALGLSGAISREQLVAACRDWNRLTSEAAAAVREVRQELDSVRRLGRVVLVDVTATRSLIAPN